MKIKLLHFVFALCLAGLLPFSSLQAAPLSSCANPHDAVKTLLDWLQPQSYDPAKAALCLNLTGEQDKGIAAKRAQQIIEVLDAKGLFVKLDDLPTNLEHVDAAGKARYQLSPKEPDIFVERIGDRWLWSARTVTRIPQIYRSVFVVDTHGFVRSLPQWMQAQSLGMAIWQFAALLGLLILGLLVRLLTRGVFGVQTRITMRRLKVNPDEALIKQVGNPLGTLAATGLAIVVLPLFLLPVQLNQLVLLALRLVCAISAVVALYRVVDLLTAWLEERANLTDTKLDDQLVPLARRAMKIFIVSIGTVFILQNMNYDVASLIAGLGIGGLAFALAAKDTIANLFGSATIFASRPFQIGDWVNVSGSEGVVESVGFRSTRIRTFYNSLVSIPNSRVADSVVDNYGAREFRRFKTVLGLTYDTTPQQMQAFVEGVRAVLKSNPAVRQEYYEVHFNSFGDSSLNVLVYAFFKTDSWTTELTEKHNILLDIMRLASELGVSFAFPTQTLHLESVAEPGKQVETDTQDAAALANAVDAFAPGGKKMADDRYKVTNGYWPDA